MELLGWLLAHDAGRCTAAAAAVRASAVQSLTPQKHRRCDTFSQAARPCLLTAELWALPYGYKLDNSGLRGGCGQQEVTANT